MPARLAMAYAIIALMLVAVATFAWWRRYNARHRRDARARARLEERYRQRDEAAAAER